MARPDTPVMLGATSLLSSWTLLAMTMVRKVPAVKPCSLFGKHLSSRKRNQLIYEERSGSALIRLFWILGNPDPDPGAWKLTKINKYGKPGFLPFRKAFFTFGGIFYQLPTICFSCKNSTFCVWPVYGSGSALVWLSGSGWIRLEIKKLDPDHTETNAEKKFQQTELYLNKNNTCPIARLLTRKLFFLEKNCGNIKMTSRSSDWTRPHL